MKLTVSILLLAAVSHAANTRESSRRQNNPDSNTEKRGLEEGNAGFEKRAPVLPTASSPVTPGIEYADSKETQADKSPSQQIYATPVPQIAKISDVLTGQGPPFQAAIASHLYAPVSIYQPRLGAPRTYEVSNPIASQLAYSEHKISYQPPQNAIQYNEPLQYNQKLPALKQPNFARPINFQQPYQQLFAQPQPLVYSQQPQLVPAPPLYQQLPHIQFQVQRPVQYVENQVPQQQFVQQPAYTQEQQNLVQVFPTQTGITYAREEVKNSQPNEQPAQRPSPPEEERTKLKSVDNQAPPPRENYNAKHQGPISFASFSQSQPAQTFAQPSPIQYQAQPQYEAQQFYRLQPQPQQYQPQNIYIQQPPQIQYQNILPKFSQESLATASTKNPSLPEKQISFFRPGPVFQQLPPQVFQQQTYQQNTLPVNSGHGTPSSLSLVPSFPPVQYFGKYAQSIFGGHHQQ